MNPELRSRAANLLGQLTDSLLESLGHKGHWTGELSSSALSTAVATIAFCEVDHQTGHSRHRDLIHRGLSWLANHANADGGWGDTTRSRSNLSTTALAWAAFAAAKADAAFATTVARAHEWIRSATGAPERLVPAIEERYGIDRTFSVPIVLTLALSGRLGPAGWRKVRPLPFELAALPRSWFGALQLPVVSYALPALIALGQAIHHHAPSRNPLVRALRHLTRPHSSKLLCTLQPDNGGFLEATPLTAFVTMSLASMGQAEHPVAVRGAGFLRASVRADGSWPIDTHLATWVTTLAVKGLSHQPRKLPPGSARSITSWLVNQQFRVVHPYTGAAPGGWAWTDLPGGVPDADDTAGALLALHHLALTQPSESCSGCPASPPVNQLPPDLFSAVTSGIQWLLDLQNRDGGIPTFCRGWGRLPFDRSAPDLTAHAIRAWTAWSPYLPLHLRQRLARASRRAFNFLRTAQRADGSWVPLWFGNEHAAADENPVYGTSLVLRSIPHPTSSPRAEGSLPFDPDRRRRGVDFLVRSQHPKGGWGGASGAPPSVEETCLALSALAGEPGAEDACNSGVAWLVTALTQDDALPASPIGLYFARLWYWERLYPLVFAIDALGSLLANHDRPEDRRSKDGRATTQR